MRTAPSSPNKRCIFVHETQDVTFTSVKNQPQRRKRCQPDFFRNYIGDQETSPVPLMYFDTHHGHFTLSRLALGNGCVFTPALTHLRTLSVYRCLNKLSMRE